MYALLDSTSQADHWMLWFAGVSMGAFLAGIALDRKLVWGYVGLVGLLLTLYFGDWR